MILASPRNPVSTVNISEHRRRTKCPVHRDTFLSRQSLPPPRSRSGERHPRADRAPRCSQFSEVFRNTREDHDSPLVLWNNGNTRGQTPLTRSAASILPVRLAGVLKVTTASLIVINRGSRESWFSARREEIARLAPLRCKCCTRGHYFWISTARGWKLGCELPLRYLPVHE